MSKPTKITLFDSLQAVSMQLKNGKFAEAISLLQGILQTGMQQKLPLMLQRYLAELSMECLELSGDCENTLSYVEQALKNYQDNPPNSPEAQKDQHILMLRKSYLLIKLDQADALNSHIDIFKQQLSAAQDKKLQNTFSRMRRFSSAAMQSIVMEQRNLGLFHLSEQLKKQGAGHVCGVR